MKLYPSYKYDNKNRFYPESSMSNKQYRKMIENAQPRYMDDYNNIPNLNPRRNDKLFNNLLNNYYSDYNKFKNKYIFPDIDENYEEEEEQLSELDFNEYMEKKKKLYGLFFDDKSDISDTTFDLMDNSLINDSFFFFHTMPLSHIVSKGTHPGSEHCSLPQ